MFFKLYPSDQKEHPVKVGWSKNKENIWVQEIKAPTPISCTAEARVYIITSVGSLYNPYSDD
jgi:hypothetical protein